MPISVAPEIQSYISQVFGEQHIQPLGFLEEISQGEYAIDVLVTDLLQKRHLRLHVKSPKGYCEVSTHEVL